MPSPPATRPRAGPALGRLVGRLVARLRGVLRRLGGRRAVPSPAPSAVAPAPAPQALAELMRGALESLDEGIALYTPDDRLVFCNERFREINAPVRDVLMPGSAFEAVLRLAVARGQYAAAAGREDEWIAQRLLVRRRAERSLVQRLADGRILRVIDRRMADGHTVTALVDISDLVRATESAEAADRGKSDFIATVSHELRTPLQVITGFSDLGCHFAQEHAQFRPMFADIHAAGQRMLRLVNGLLDLSKFDGSSDRLPLKRQPLAPLAAGVVDELRALAAERSVTLVCTPPAALHADADAFRLQQVLRNVVANALRFAPAGSAVEVGGRDRGLAGVELWVRDHGPGIPPDELETIFEPFVQSSRTRDRAGGTGLGLAICRRLMAAHGGRITAELPDDGGARFVLWLPPASPEPPAPAAPAAPAVPRVSLAALRAANRASHAPSNPRPAQEARCLEPS